MKTIDKIITKVDTSRGAPMGRANVIPQKFSIVDIGAKHKYVCFIGATVLCSYNKTLFDCAVPMSCYGEYDKGGAYWGLGNQLRVKYTKDLSYIEFYRN